MPQTNRKSSLGHWYAPVLAPDFPRDQYAHCMDLLEALEIGDAVKADCKVEEVDSFFSVLKRTEMLTVNGVRKPLRPQ